MMANALFETSVKRISFCHCERIQYLFSSKESLISYAYIYYTGNFWISLSNVGKLANRKFTVVDNNQPYLCLILQFSARIFVHTAMSHILSNMSCRQVLQ